MSAETQAILLNGVPLLAVAVLYAAVTGLLVPGVWRERSRATLLDLAITLIFPALAIVAGVLGWYVIDTRAAVAMHPWASFAATLTLAAPAVFFLASGGRPRLLLTGWLRLREAEERISAHDRELGAVALLSRALARARSVEDVARTVVEQVCELLPVDLTGLETVDEEHRVARGVLARQNGRDVGWWPELLLDLDGEPSGTATVVARRLPLIVDDSQRSPVVNRRLVEATHSRSLVFVPMPAGERVIGVLVVGTVTVRTFTEAEVSLLQAVAAEAALALERVRSQEALTEALDRERLVARIARRVRSELDLDAVLRAATHETAAALGVSRCFVALGDPDAALSVQAEWVAPGAASAIGVADRLAGSNLALRERRTVAVADVESAPDLDDPTLGGRRPLLELGTRSVLATPIVVFDRVIGVFTLHRAEPSEWSPADVTFAEAVARELGAAINTAKLLAENRERLEQQEALLKASQVVAGELRLEVVLQRLVTELTNLLRADAADCYLLDRRRGTLRCAAVYGLDRSVLGLEMPAQSGLSGAALQAGHGLASNQYSEAPHEAYHGFARAIAAPMVWGGEVQGVVGIGTRDADGVYEQRHVEAVEAFAALGALALRNAASFEQSARQARIERGFSRIASVLAEPLSLRETYAAVAQAASEALDGSFAAVLTPDDELGLTLAGDYALPDALRPELERGVPAGAEVLARCAEQGRVLSASNLADDDRFDERWSAIRDGWTRSLLAIPLVDARHALVLVFFAELRSFTDDDVELSRNVAAAAQGALERSGFYEAERRSRALFQQLARTASLLATELDPGAVVSEVVEQAPALLGADACVLWELAGETLVGRAAHGEGAEAALGAELSATGRLAGDAVQSRAPVVLPAAGDDATLSGLDPLLAAGYRGYLGVPLVGGEGTLLGVVALYARARREWRAEEVEALQALAGNASAALANARLYQNVALAQERSDAILESVADGIVAVDRDGRVVLWNRAAEEITGVPHEEALGRDPADLLRRDLAAGVPDTSGNRLLAIPRGGEEVWLSVTEAVMRDPAGGIAGRVYAFRDVSGERLVEEMKSEFVASVSHELRAPLTSIYGFAETLLRRDVLFEEEERSTFLGYIATEAERLTNIVDQLLNVARLDAGDLQVTLEPTDVAELVSEAVSRVEQQSEANGHRFVLELPEEPITADADREKLRQVLANLLDNAVRYSPEGGTVTVGARRKGDAVEVRVEDEGVGIAPAEQALIFHKFYRGLDPARHGGAGLGLFIARGLVSAMGGRMSVSSARGRGSSFVFELPLATADAPLAEAR